MGKKIRLDVAVFERGYAPSREKARAIIMAGQVYVNNQRADKAGFEVKEGDILEVRGSTLKYVSRGGLKLEKAIRRFPIDLNGKICMDVGASTGGFTDCMLMNGASKVYSVDVGYGQLAWKLRCDERVVNLERTNFRYADETKITDKIDFASVDVSFISLKLIFPNLKKFLKADASAVCLIKPQFEAGKEKVGKKGVVRDVSVHSEVVNRVIGQAADAGFSVMGLDYSPVKGPEGNIEYLMWISPSDNPAVAEDIDAAEIVYRSHEELQ